MKLRNALVASALAAALLVPAAGAKPGNGNGNGNGNGPPAWAGGSNGGAKANGKPAWAGQGQARKAEKAQRKLERRAARAADEVGPKHLNPAWVCKFEREEMGAEAFAEEYGDKPNAFGKCVSQEAHERDGVEADDGDTPEPGESEDGESSDDDASALADALAALESLLESLKQLL